MRVCLSWDDTWREVLRGGGDKGTKPSGASTGVSGKDVREGGVGGFIDRKSGSFCSVVMGSPIGVGGTVSMWIGVDGSNMDIGGGEGVRSMGGRGGEL